MIQTQINLIPFLIAGIQFTHEKLFRPKSASLPLTKRLNQENTFDTSDENEKVAKSLHSHCSIKRPVTKKTKRRRPRSVTYNRSSHTASTDANSGFVIQSLIRQSHRPTTSIIYSKPDANGMPSITPCVRKARVSHKTITCTHQQTTDSASERTQSRKTMENSEENQSLNTAVKVSKLSKPSPEKGDTISTKITQEVPSLSNQSRLTPPEESTQQQEGRSGKFAVSVGEDEADSMRGETLNDLQRSENRNSSQDDMGSETPVVADPDSKCPATGDHTHVPQEDTSVEQLHPNGVKIRPLVMQHVAKFNGRSTNEITEIRKKNKMIRQWLKTLN